jgi:hypothetical protein
MRAAVARASAPVAAPTNGTATLALASVHAPQASVSASYARYASIRNIAPMSLAGGGSAQSPSASPLATTLICSFSKSTCPWPTPRSIIQSKPDAAICFRESGSSRPQIAMPGSFKPGRMSPWCRRSIRRVSQPTTSSQWATTWVLRRPIRSGCMSRPVPRSQLLRSGHLEGRPTVCRRKARTQDSKTHLDQDALGQ